MKRWMAIGVLAVLGAVCWGAGEAGAATWDVDCLDTFFLVAPNGQTLEKGDTVYIKRNEVLQLQVLPTYVRRTASLDQPVTVKIEQPNQGDIHLFYTLRPEPVVTISASNVVDHMIYIQVTTTVPGASDYVSDSFPLHVQTPSGTGGLPAPELSYVYIPRSIRLRHLDGKDASSLVIEATKNATLYVDVDDFGRDGNPLNDYVIFPVSPQNIQITGRLNTDDEAIVVGSSSYSPLIGQTPDSPPPTRLGTVTLHARNAGGTESSGYDPLYTEVRYELAFAGTTASGANISNIMPGDNGETTLQTPWVSVTVTPHDDGDGGSGGTCGVLGMGATALMILPLAFLRKKRGKSA